MRSRGAISGRTTVAGLSLVKLAAGHYRTEDGRFSLLRDEHTGSTAWLLQDRRSGAPELVGSLRRGAKAITAVLAAEASADRSTAPAPVGADAGVVDGSAGASRGPAETSPPGGCSAAAPVDPTSPGGSRG